MHSWIRLLLGVTAVVGAPMVASAQSEPSPIVRLGAGSYTTQLPSGAKEPDVRPFVTNAINKPVPTNDWWSSLVFLPFSNQMFPHPLAVQAHPSGLRIYYPGSGYTANPSGVFTAVMREPDDLIVGHSAQPSFPDARADGWSDWFISALFAQGQNQLRLTFGHGSPFVFGTISGGDPTVTFGAPPTIVVGDKSSATLCVSVNGRYYGLFGPSGSTWSGIGSKQFRCITHGKNYFSVALLPDGSPATLAEFAKVAHNHVTNSTVTWHYDEKKSAVVTDYAFTVKSYETGEVGTIFALFPHQYQRSDVLLTKHSYLSARGTMKVAQGMGFRTVTPFQGVLPLLPKTSTGEISTLTQLLNRDVQSYKPEVADTYWTGKALGKLATLASIADVSDNADAQRVFTERLRVLLEDYFTAGEKGGGQFYYNKPWGTLIGYPASYGSDQALNDHHFHYGYFIRAAAELARRDPAWAAQKNWGAMVELLIRDCANPSRTDPMFPFLRNFDLYEGHSWADGKGDFADGNNNESSSEAMNAWTGMILWGELTGNKTLRDAGIFLYVTEKDAIDNYWFNLHQLYPKAFTRPMASMVWGAKATYETWFSPDPICKHGINILPIQSGSFYLGTSPEYVRANVAGLTRERVANDPKAGVGKNWGGWGDVILMYQALGDPKAALRDTAFETQEMEGGNSRANLYQWLHFLDAVGQVDATVTADTPLYSVFRNGKTRTYVVYNASLKPRRVTFSDGLVIDMKPSGLTVETREVK